MRRTTLVLMFGAVLLYGAAPLARAAQAPILIDSSPRNGETVHEPPARVEMTFSEPLDDSSEIVVRDECNRRVDAGETTVELNEMSVALAKQPSGIYVASYNATGVGGVTGTTQGSISFTVHRGPTCDGSGGGHGDHGDHDAGGGGKNKHDGHRGGDGGGGHGGAHSGGSHPSGTASHGGGTHGGAVHAAGGTHGGAAHAAGNHGAHGNGGGKGKNAKHGAHHGAGADEDPTSDIAAPGDLLPAANGDTLLLALGASILVGAAGGLLMRVGVRL